MEKIKLVIIEDDKKTPVYFYGVNAYDDLYTYRNLFDTFEVRYKVYTKKNMFSRWKRMHTINDLVFEDKGDE